MSTGTEQPVTKKDLELTVGEMRLAIAQFETRIAQLETRISDKLIASERGQRLWIWGLYGLIIVSYFVHR
jgi:hypothetical protein